MPAAVALVSHPLPMAKPLLARPPSPRPSPWHEIGHSLSAASLVATTPPSEDASSQALREWQEALARPDSAARRHQLVHAASAPSLTSPVPKLAAERDKDGFIEYKLKLLEPSPERFERLVTQMMWRLKQGRNEAIYELGLADDGTVIGLTRPEMDASLRTLELMASEVGATVIVLKEIVLAKAPGWSRPDMDERGQPRRGTRSLSMAGPSNVRERKAIDGPLGRQLIFDVSGDDSDDDAPFPLDGDGALGNEAFDEPRRAAPRVKQRTAYSLQRAADKRERRRAELLRGDGTCHAPPVAPHVNVSPPRLQSAAVESSAALVPPPQPHQNRPSSLRLAEPTPDGSFIDSLLHVPLDSLSLSFADVQTVPELPGVESELICVEALVVRKVQHSGVGSDDEEQGEWAFGGDEDGWGLG